ncbi:MAG TPA: AMP-binding protein [Steroidobacteraceae bacterium]|nr:AMP-binding protein [Steroidobacteraceae bacterium]
MDTFSSAGQHVGDWPFFSTLDGSHTFAWRDGQAISQSEFQRHVMSVVAALPARGAMINLCEDRYRFLVSFAAAQCARQTVLLPAARVEQVVSEVQQAHEHSYRFDDADVDAAIASAQSGTCLRPDADHIAMIGFTSGSTGQPKPFPKRWGSIQASTANNLNAMRAFLGEQSTPSMLATVPPQHMYGMELSVLVPLFGGIAIHSGRPLFPADVAKALAELPEPRILVSTPVHMRTLVESPQTMPPTQLIVSATAPLDAGLARAVEAKFGGVLLEMFGSTETCVIARRRTAVEEEWQSYPHLTLQTSEDGTWVRAPWIATPILLQDHFDIREGHRFVVRGRNTDMVEVAGKRASLADLTRRVLSIPGVRDAVVFQPDTAGAAGIRRVAALIVAPDLSASDVLEQLRPAVDSAFLPRPLAIVEKLPRNELGKLPQAELLKMLRENVRK